MNKLIKFTMVLMMVLAVAVPIVALAQDPSVVLPPNTLGLPGEDDENAETFIIDIIQEWLLPFAGIIAVLFIIIGGFQYMFAGMNEDLAKRGKSTLRNAIIGLVIIILSYVIISVVVNTLFDL